ncbi:MAG: CDP-alcohol phosphatidyltransferase family protein [Bacteroidota bacterium]
MNQTNLKLFNLPNFLTASNLICGVLSIILAFFGRLEISALLIICAMIFDFFDGFVARKLGISSPLGKDLDSLADMVSFGLAPGILMFITIELRLNGNLGATYMKFHDFQLYEAKDWLCFCALSIPFFSLFRLAKFNNDTRQSDRFIGIPTPTNTLFFLFFPLLYWQIGIQNASPLEPLYPWVLDPFVMAFTSLLFPLLLISEIPLLSLKVKSFSLKGNVYQYLLVVISLITILVAGIYALPIIVILYLILSIIENNTRKHHEIQS